MTTASDGASTFDTPPHPLSLEKALAIIDSLNPDACRRHSFEMLRFLLCELIGGRYYPSFEDALAFPVVRGRAEPFSKIRRVNGSLEFFKLTSDLGPPPAASVKQFGRCNVPGASVFYGANNVDTALAEIRPDIDDIVYLTTYEMLPGAVAKGAAVGELDYIRRYGESRILRRNLAIPLVKKWLEQISRESDYVRVVVDAFLAELMSRPCAGELDYKAVAALSSLFLDMEAPKHAGGESEILFYPSVAHRGGLNVAMTASCLHKKFRPLKARMVMVKAYLGYGIYQTTDLATCDDLSGEKIQWTILESRIAGRQG